MKSFGSGPIKMGEHTMLDEEPGDNTKDLVLEIATMGAYLTDLFKDQDLRPVIMIDGLAGAGKSTFTKAVVASLKEAFGVNVCTFAQDAFGLDRDTRRENKINQCADLARDPKTVSKLCDVMAGRETRIPSYDASTGVRIKDAKSLPSGDLIVYEGVSSLSAVIYENAEFDEDHRNAVPIKIFFRTDTEETLYNARSKRDIEGRGVTPIDFSDAWDDSQRNNWIYTMRGITHANFVITRTKDNWFDVLYLRPVTFLKNQKKHRIPCSLYRPLSPHDRRQQLAFFKKERRDVLMKNLSRWFSAHHDVLRYALEFQHRIKQRCAVDLKYITSMRDALAKDHLADKTARGTSSLLRAADDQLASPPPAGLKKRYEHAFFRISEGRPQETRDDMELIGDQYYSLFQQSLAHDARFNLKNRVALENALACVVIDNIRLVKGSVERVTQKLLAYFSQLADQFIDGRAGADAASVIKFLLTPFLPHSPDQELGRMLVEPGEDPSELDVLKWLLNTLNEEVNASNFFTHMRFHIRFMHLIAEQGNVQSADLPPKLTAGFIPDEAARHIKDLNVVLRPKVAFDPAKKRGRSTHPRHRQEKLTTTFGTYVDIHDVPFEFRKFIGLRTLPIHSAGKAYIIAISTTMHNRVAFKRDHPLVSSASGAMPFFMCAADFAGLRGEELEKYHLVTVASMIAGGHHALTECLASSQLYKKLSFSDSSLKGLLPKALQSEPCFAELIALSDRPEFSKLWVNFSASAAQDRPHPSRKK